MNTAIDTSHRGGRPWPCFIAAIGGGAELSARVGPRARPRNALRGGLVDMKRASERAVVSLRSTTSLVLTTFVRDAKRERGLS